MKVEQLYTGCLAEAAYYIESNGEAAIIDPLRETEPYIKKLEERGAKLKYILETHFHADFVSGHLDLAKKTGATIVFGPNAVAEYDIHVAKDNEDLKLGDVTIRVLHTPGHTMESSTFLLIDENGKDNGIFTGDTLFIGDVGRPDLAVKTDLSREDLARHLYDSIYNKIMPLADDVIVYPGHGKGSACGKNMSDETTDTLGNQKEKNYALQPMEKEEFVEKVVDGLTPPPQYFPKNAMLNKKGYESFDSVIAKGLTALDPDTFEDVANAHEALIIDTRLPEEFVAGFIPNSIFIGVEGSFASWVGTLVVDLQHPILFIADEGKEEEVVTRLSRVGYDNTIGFLKGGIEAWKAAGKQLDYIKSINPHAFAELAEKTKTPTVVDVRRYSEFNQGHLLNANNIPLDYINDNMSRFNKEDEYYVHCAGGYRSVVTASILKARGFDNVVNIEEGFGGIQEKTNLPIVTDVLEPEA
jgi:hydroxyacylglutathione hydrolase